MICKKQRNNDFGELRIIIDGDFLYFSGPDVCRCLGYTSNNPSDRIKSHVNENEIRKFSNNELKTQGINVIGSKGITFITESGLKEFVNASKKRSPEYRKIFMDWINYSVIPVCKGQTEKSQPSDKNISSKAKTSRTIVTNMLNSNILRDIADIQKRSIVDIVDEALKDYICKVMRTRDFKIIKEPDCESTYSQK